MIGDWFMVIHDFTTLSKSRDALQPHPIHLPGNIAWGFWITCNDNRYLQMSTATRLYLGINRDKCNWELERIDLGPRGSCLFLVKLKLELLNR